MVPHPPRNQLQAYLDMSLGRQERHNRPLRIFIGSALFLMIWIICFVLLTIFFVGIPSVIPPIKYLLNVCIQIPEYHDNFISINASEPCTLRGWVRNILGLASTWLTIYTLTRPENAEKTNRYRD